MDGSTTSGGGGGDDDDAPRIVDGVEMPKRPKTRPPVDDVEYEEDLEDVPLDRATCRACANTVRDGACTNRVRVWTH